MTNPDLSTLPQRMRYAAEVLYEANERYRQKFPQVGYWSAEDLGAYANKWEAHDRAAAERDIQIDELAMQLCDIENSCPVGGRQYVAQKLIESGWRKGEPA